jgi:hypothetical protein
MTEGADHRHFFGLPRRRHPRAGAAWQKSTKASATALRPPYERRLATQSRSSNDSKWNRFADAISSRFTCIRIAQTINKGEEAFGPTLDKLRLNGFLPLVSREDQS